MINKTTLVVLSVSTLLLGEWGLVYSRSGWNAASRDGWEPAGNMGWAWGPISSGAKVLSSSGWFGVTSYLNSLLNTETSKWELKLSNDPVTHRSLSIKKSGMDWGLLQHGVRGWESVRWLPGPADNPAWVSVSSCSSVTWPSGKHAHLAGVFGIYSTIWPTIPIAPDMKGQVSTTNCRWRPWVSGDELQDRLVLPASVKMNLVGNKPHQSPWRELSRPQ